MKLSKVRMRSVVAGTLGLIGALSSVTAGAAVDSKIYPGSMCKVANSAWGSTTTGTGYAGYLQNYAGVVGVTCPVVRDQAQGTTPASAWVSVYDPTTTWNVWCQLYSSNSLAGTIAYSTGSTTDPFKGNDVLIMSNVATGNGWWDSLNIKCSLPENAKIYSYNVDETVQTD